MSFTVTITQLNDRTTEWLRKEAARTGKSIEVIARQLIDRGIEVESQEPKVPYYHDLDALAGTWSKEEASEFNHAVAAQEQIDPALWS